MSEVKTKITIAQTLEGWPLFLLSQKFTLQDEVIYHQVIPSFYYSSASQFFVDFGAHFVETQARFQQTCLLSWTFPAYKARLKISSRITFQT